MKKLNEKKDEDNFNRDELLKKIEKVKMSAKKPPKGLKNNIELGRDLDLYIVNEIIGQGLPLLTPKGTILKREIEKFAVEEELKRGYLHTSTPLMASSDLYKLSGHWQHFQKDMFVMDVGKKKFALRPMTCPFQFILYKRKPRSYKDIPLKYAEISTLFRNEQSGELRGLTRVRQMTLADAHIICTPDQLEEEFTKVLEFLKYIMKKFGIEKDIWYQFSKSDSKNKEKYIQDKKAWESSQKMMKKILDKSKLKYIEAEGEAAFYGPKLDLQYKDVYGKEDTLLTIQIDFALPERYNMTYKDKDNKLKRPIVIHRSSTGTTERMMSFLLEKYQGSLPLWLSPVQVKVLPMTDRNVKKSEEVSSKLKESGMRVEIDDDDEPISKKVRTAQLEKVNYMVTIGDKEESSNSLAIRSRDGKVKFNVKLNDFINNLKKEIK
jgi:threonyl-tRNA synthetase